jgi:hypothetical protein
MVVARIMQCHRIVFIPFQRLGHPLLVDENRATHRSEAVGVTRPAGFLECESGHALLRRPDNV